MADDRYNRWQGLAITQLSVAIALIYGISIGGLGVGFSALQDKEIAPSASLKVTFLLSLFLLLFAIFCSCGAVITRLLDFRLTARKVRKNQKPEYSPPLTIFRLGPEAYGRATWSLFWLSCLSCIVGAILLVVSIGAAYADRWQ